jgi:predicted metal-binding membrane protein
MMPAMPLESVLKRDRVIVALAIGSLTLLAWIYTLYLAANMNGMAAIPNMPSMPGMKMAAPAIKPWSADDLTFAFLMWTVMMAGMMTPSATPMILLYARVGRQARAEEKPFASTFWFIGGYLLAWTAFAAFATIAQAVLSSVSLLTPMLASANNLFAGIVLIAAGIYQWTPLKNACLWACQLPFAFLSRHGGFKRDPLPSLALGLKHGLYCVGCCWALMALLFVVGVMNVLWIAGLAILILLEKTVPGGRFPSRALGLVLIIAGAIFLYRTGM